MKGKFPVACRKISLEITNFLQNYHKPQICKETGLKLPRSGFVHLQRITIFEVTIKRLFEILLMRTLSTLWQYYSFKVTTISWSSPRFNFLMLSSGLLAKTGNIPGSYRYPTLIMIFLATKKFTLYQKTNQVLGHWQYFYINSSLQAMPRYDICQIINKLRIFACYTHPLWNILS